MKKAKAILTRHGPVQLIDVLKETALRTGMLTHLTSISTRENIEQSTLWERMLLVAYALGTNVGIRAVAHSSGYSEDDLRYVARRYFTLDGLRASAAAIGNATFAARQETIWGTGTTTVASDSTHFRAYDQNLFTEWHTRYRGRGVLIYWHVEKGAVAIHAQHLKCTASALSWLIIGPGRAIKRRGCSSLVSGLIGVDADDNYVRRPGLRTCGRMSNVGPAHLERYQYDAGSDDGPDEPAGTDAGRSSRLLDLVQVELQELTSGKPPSRILNPPYYPILTMDDGALWRPPTDSSTQNVPLTFCLD